MMSARLRFSLDLVESPLSLDAAVLSRTSLDNFDYRRILLSGSSVNQDCMSRLLAVSSLIGQLF